MVGEALLWTLEKGLGNDWNLEVKKAWLACYDMISETMISAAEPKLV
jgi:hemoglobin-like flavoprotein